MSDWEWLDDPEPSAPSPVERALAASGSRNLRHNAVSVQLSNHDIGSPPDYALCSVPHSGWVRYRLVMLSSGEHAPAFDYLESQAFPVIDIGTDAAEDHRATIQGARQFGLDLLNDAHELLHTHQEAERQ
jgi:hypothetical protein